MSETSSCQAYALGSGNVDAPDGVAVGGIGVGVEVGGIGVGGRDVDVTGSTVAVKGTGVLVSLHAKSDSTNKSRNRFIYLLSSYISVASASTTSPEELLPRLLSIACMCSLTTSSGHSSTKRFEPSHKMAASSSAPMMGKTTPGARSKGKIRYATEASGRALRKTFTRLSPISRAISLRRLTTSLIIPPCGTTTFPDFLSLIFISYITLGNSNNMT